MFVHLVVAGSALIIVFILFLVIARTLNTIINQLTKLEYLIGKEKELKTAQASLAAQKAKSPIEAVDREDESPE
jgi:hypothetical protein